MLLKKPLGRGVPTTIISPKDYYHRVSDVDPPSIKYLSIDNTQGYEVYRVYQQCTGCFTAYWYTAKGLFYLVFFQKTEFVPDVPRV